MQKVLLILATASTLRYAKAAGCEYYYGWINSNELAFYIVESDSCPSGYMETAALKIVDNSTACPSGYIAAANYKEIVCDSSKGTCGTAYVCPAQ